MEPPETMSTQLADSRPQFDVALRVAIPINAPARSLKLSRDALIRNNAFSPASYVVTRQLMAASNTGELGNMERILTSNETAALNLDSDSSVKTLIKDYTMVAASSRRAGKKDVEASAYVSLGVIYDNQGKLHEGIEYYLKYLSICEEINDDLGCACACNCLGVNYMLLASPATDVSILAGIKKNPAGFENLNKANFYHAKHLEIGPDGGGHFVAHSNLGLCHGMRGDIVQSAQHHQDALRIAIKMQTLYGQAIAVGNLGALALQKEDLATSRTCFEQHLQLVQSLSDSAAEIKAWEMLASLCTLMGSHSDALENLIQAQQICEKESFFNELRRINCLIGVAKGSLDFADHADKMLQKCLRNSNNV
jgi:tetratricopeptide (TPR) repeat protein